MFYAAHNHYSTPTSIGFSNTWLVLAFDTKANRNAWVDGNDGKAARAITRKDIPKFVSREPKLFTSERYALWSLGYYDNIPGCLGSIDVCAPYDAGYIQPLNS